MKVFYFLFTFLESGLAVFGIRAPFETPPYRVVAQLSGGVEIRAYGPAVAAQTQIAPNDRAAFSRLFRYITGANLPETTIAMTTPVEMAGVLGHGTGPEDGAAHMRFFLPKAMAGQPPHPTDSRVKIVELPARTVAVLRFSGPLDRKSVERHESALRAALAKTNRRIEGGAYVMGYDPPFTIPFLRRNEVAVDVEA